MSYTPQFSDPPPDRANLDVQPGALVVEFGAPWCGHCRAAQPLVQSALAAQPQVVHLRVEDGPGRRLGRSYRVKLWPTLIFLRDGVEQARVVRPTDAEALRAALASIIPT